MNERAFDKLRPHLRRLLNELFREESEFRAFTLDYFAAIAQEVLSHGSRTDRINSLFLKADLHEIVTAVRTVCGGVALKSKLAALDADSMTAIQQAGIIPAVISDPTPELTARSNRLEPPSATPNSTVNPYQKAGTLSPISQSYVRRICDEQLAEALSSRRLISVTGEWQIGKSSLLLQMQHSATSHARTCFVDLQDLRVDNPEKFHRSFFELLSYQLGEAVDDWLSLGNAMRRAPFILFLDEFGRMAHIAEQFVPALCRFSDLHQVSIIVGLPVPIEKFLKGIPAMNPKYGRTWFEICVEPLGDKEIGTLLNLLPDAARFLAWQNVDEIIRRSRRRPQPLQCLCYELFAAARKGLSSDSLIRYIKDQAFYQ